MQKLYTLFLVLLTTGGGYYLGTQYPASSFFVDNATPTVSRDVVELLNQLNTVTRQPDATLDDVNDLLVESYGPCWGIPDGACRE